MFPHDENTVFYIIINFCFYIDVGSFQVSTNLEASSQSQTWYDAALRSQTPQDADQVSGPTMAQK